jgi:glyoxylase-like metal-dependent hydrolase (beta-lactamase superfamily II)
MIFERFVVGMLQTNCYLLGDPATRNGVVIDPGGDGERILKRIHHHGLKVASILLTHGHFDHVLDAWLLKERLGARVFLHRSDEGILRDRPVGLVSLLTAASKSPKGTVDQWLEEGDELDIGSIRLHVLETPGHTPGHVSFHWRERQVVFVGDTLFAGSIGRTDFPGGSYERLLLSVREKIFPLASETAVHPGHGPETTVGVERRTNPFFH